MRGATGDWFLRQAWRRAAGRPEEQAPGLVPPLAELRETEWVPEFERLQRNRLIMGRFRYGAMEDESKGGYDQVASLRRRLDLYEQTGNLEHLVDVANLAMVEFRHSRHPRRHFHAADDGEHCAERRADR